MKNPVVAKLCQVGSTRATRDNINNNGEKPSLIIN
jgi:hypothetical protein